MAYGQVENLGIRLALLGVASVWIFTLLASLVKHRLFQEATVKKFQSVERFHTPVKTSEALESLDRKQTPKWLESYSGFGWLKSSAILMLAVTLLFFDYTTYQIAKSYMNSGSSLTITSIVTIGIPLLFWLISCKFFRAFKKVRKTVSVHRSK